MICILRETLGRIFKKLNKKQMSKTQKPPTFSYQMQLQTTKQLLVQAMTILFLMSSKFTTRKGFKWIREMAGSLVSHGDSPKLSQICVSVYYTQSRVNCIITGQMKRCFKSIRCTRLYSLSSLVLLQQGKRCSLLLMLRKQKMLPLRFTLQLTLLQRLMSWERTKLSQSQLIHLLSKVKLNSKMFGSDIHSASNSGS